VFPRNSQGRITELVGTNLIYRLLSPNEITTVHRVLCCEIASGREDFKFLTFRQLKILWITIFPLRKKKI